MHVALGLVSIILYRILVYFGGGRVQMQAFAFLGAKFNLIRLSPIGLL